MRGDKFVFGTFQVKEKAILKNLVCRCLEVGVKTFDTAPSYQTESFLGEILSEIFANTGNRRTDISVQTKIDGWQMQESKGNIHSHVHNALHKMQLDYFDTVFIHWPFPEFLTETWNSLIELKRSGLIRNIGLCNVRQRHVIKLQNTTNVLPDVIQIECHPLRNAKKEIQFFHSNYIKVQAYSPLCRMDTRVSNSEVLKRIAMAHGCTLVQVVMRWHYQNGVLPVFMTKKVERIKDNTGIEDISLSQKEMNAIDNMDINYNAFVESMCCPGF